MPQLGDVDDAVQSLTGVIISAGVGPSPRSAVWMGGWGGAEVRMVTTTAEQPEHSPAEDEVSIEELARRQGVGPVVSLDELAQPDLWESEQEYEDFLADLYASRKSNVA